MNRAALSSMALDAGIVAGILATRLNGQRFSPSFAKLIHELPPDQGLLVDGSGVAILDASFADEVFGVIASRRMGEGWKGKCFALSGLSVDNLKNVEVALDSRAVHIVGLRNCVLPIIDKASSNLPARLIGKTEGHVRESFNVLLQNGMLTARMLAESLGLDIHAASTRLKVLHDLGLATRTEQRDETGRGYEYNWPF